MNSYPAYRPANFLIGLLLACLLPLLSCTPTQQTDKPDSPVNPPTRPSERPSPGDLIKRPGAPEVSADLKVGSKLAVYEFKREAARPEAVQERMQAIIPLLLGNNEAARALDKSELKEAISGKEKDSWMPLSALPLFVKYDSRYDEIRMINTEREAKETDLADIGIRAIQQKAEEYLKALVANKVIDGRLYANAVTQIGYKQSSGGTVKAGMSPGKVLEYRITFRPRLQGMELANTGIRMGITTQGELANLRLGGATPQGDWKDTQLVPAEQLPTRTIVRTTNDVMSDFYKTQLADGSLDLAYSKVMYVMPEDKAAAVVEPMLVVSFSTQRTIDDQVVVSRRKVLAYSLSDAQAAPIDFTPPSPQHSGQTQERQ